VLGLPHSFCKYLSFFAECVKQRLASSTRIECNAGVNVILTCCNGVLRVLMIEKTPSAGYPWSGDLAFPGGRVEFGESIVDAIHRETLEETCIERKLLEELGFLPVASPRNAPHIIVAPLVTIYRGRCSDIPQKPCSREASRIALVGFPHQIHSVEFLHPVRRTVFRGYKDWYGNIVWGMSLRILNSLHQVVGECYRVFSSSYGKESP